MPRVIQAKETAESEWTPVADLPEFQSENEVFSFAHNMVLKSVYAVRFSWHDAALPPAPPHLTTFQRIEVNGLGMAMPDGTQLIRMLYADKASDFVDIEAT